MKKKIFVLVSTLCFSSLAYAQSNVTLYGLLDTGFTYANSINGKSATQMTSGPLQTSRIGFKGSEYLGNGLSAIFQLEAGFNSTNGSFSSQDQLFNRIATIGLSSTQYGSIVLGRQLDAYSSILGATYISSVWIANASHPGDTDNTFDSRRVSNAITYTSPSYAGLTFSGTYGFSNLPGGAGQERTWSVASQFNNGPLSVAVGYLNSLNPNFMANGDPTQITNQTNPIYDGYVNAKSYESAALGLAYTIGDFTIAGMYSNVRFNDLPNAKAKATFNNAEINLKYQVTPAYLVGISYYYTHGSDKENGSANYHQINLATDYALSKRTDIYAAVIYQLAKGTNSRGEKAVASSVYGTSSTDKQTSLTVGIRHKF